MKFRLILGKETITCLSPYGSFTYFLINKKAERALYICIMDRGWRESILTSPELQEERIWLGTGKRWGSGGGGVGGGIC